MFKSNIPVLILTVIASLYIFLSCNKTEQEKNVIPETPVKTDIGQDSAKTNPLIDTTPALKHDSIKAPKNAEKKRRNDSLKALKETEVKILAYYFHPTARCVTCRNIEAYSYEAIQEWEKKNKKKVTWQELNIEDSVNEHFVKEYSLEFSSLIIVKYVGGKKDKWKNLEETWKLVNDKNSFIKYVMHELSRFAKEKS
jgi:hypothetical protein